MDAEIKVISAYNLELSEDLSFNNNNNNDNSTISYLRCNFYTPRYMCTKWYKTTMTSWCTHKEKTWNKSECSLASYTCCRIFFFFFSISTFRLHSTSFFDDDHHFFLMISVRPAGWLIVRCGKNFNVAVFSDTMNVINFKLCMMVLLTHWALPVHTSFGALDHISRSQVCPTILIENFIFSSD